MLYIVITGAVIFVTYYFIMSYIKGNEAARKIYNGIENVTLPSPFRIFPILETEEEKDAWLKFLNEKEKRDKISGIYLYLIKDAISNRDAAGLGISIIAMYIIPPLCFLIWGKGLWYIVAIIIAEGLASLLSSFAKTRIKPLNNYLWLATVSVDAIEQSAKEDAADLPELLETTYHDVLQTKYAQRTAYGITATIAAMGAAVLSFIYIIGAVKKVRKRNSKTLGKSHRESLLCGIIFV